MISVSSVVKFVQLAYNYESWEVFESLVQPIINHLRPLCGEDKHLIEMKSLEVLQAFSPMNMSKSRKKVTMGMEEKDSTEAVSAKHSSGMNILKIKIKIIKLMIITVDRLFLFNLGLHC